MFKPILRTYNQVKAYTYCIELKNYLTIDDEVLEKMYDHLLEGGSNAISINEKFITWVGGKKKDAFRIQTADWKDPDVDRIVLTANAFTVMQKQYVPPRSSGSYSSSCSGCSGSSGNNNNNNNNNNS